MSKPRFIKKRLDLGIVFSRSTDNSNHWIGSSFKAISVIGSNNASFQLSILGDPRGNSDAVSLPLFAGFYHNYTQSPADGVFENSVVQSGVYVDVLISTEDELTSAPEIQSVSDSSVTLVGGATFSQNNVSIDSSGTSTLIGADVTRFTAEVQNNSAVAIWVGSSANVAHADFRKKCRKIDPNGTFVWDLPTALLARTEATIEDEITVLEKKA